MKSRRLARLIAWSFAIGLALIHSGIGSARASGGDSPLGTILRFAEPLADLRRAHRLVATSTSVAYDAVRIPTTMRPAPTTWR